MSESAQKILIICCTFVVCIFLLSQCASKVPSVEVSPKTDYEKALSACGRLNDSTSKAYCLEAVFNNSKSLLGGE